MHPPQDTSKLGHAHAVYVDAHVRHVPAAKAHDMFGDFRYVHAVHADF